MWSGGAWDSVAPKRRSGLFGDGVITRPMAILAVGTEVGTAPDSVAPRMTRALLEARATRLVAWEALRIAFIIVWEADIWEWLVSEKLDGRRKLLAG